MAAHSPPGTLPVPAELSPPNMVRNVPVSDQTAEKVSGPFPYISKRPVPDATPTATPLSPAPR